MGVEVVVRSRHRTESRQERCLDIVTVVTVEGHECRVCNVGRGPNPDRTSGVPTPP